MWTGWGWDRAGGEILALSLDSLPLLELLSCWFFQLYVGGGSILSLCRGTLLVKILRLLKIAERFFVCM